MFSIRNLLVIAIVGGGAFVFAPEPQSNEAVAQTQSRYWNNYWRWYDNDYRTYYNRQYQNRSRDFGYGYNPYYRSQFNQPYNQPSNWYGQPYDTYYRNGRFRDDRFRGDGRVWDPRRSINVGGRTIRWR